MTNSDDFIFQFFMLYYIYCDLPVFVLSAYRKDPHGQKVAHCINDNIYVFKGILFAYMIAINT